MSLINDIRLRLFVWDIFRLVRWLCMKFVLLSVMQAVKNKKDVFRNKNPFQVFYRRASHAMIAMEVATDGF